MSVTSEQFEEFFKVKVEPGFYEVEYKIVGGLVVGGFTIYGVPIPGEQTDILNLRYVVEVVANEESKT